MTHSFSHDADLKALIENNLEQFDVVGAEHDGKAAAVALPVVETGLGADLDGMGEYKTWQD